MPHPTPRQIAYGSATVVSTTFAMLLLSPTLAGAAVAAVATLGLILGILAALALRSRQGSPGHPIVSGQTQVPTQRQRPRSVETTERPEVKV